MYTMWGKRASISLVKETGKVCSGVWREDVSGQKPLVDLSERRKQMKKHWEKRIAGRIFKFCFVFRFEVGFCNGAHISLEVLPLSP